MRRPPRPSLPGTPAGPRTGHRARRSRMPVRTGAKRGNSGHVPAIIIAVALIIGVVGVAVAMNSRAGTAAGNATSPSAQPPGAKPAQGGATQTARQGGRLWNVRLVPNAPVRLRVNLDDPEPGIAEAAKAMYEADKKEAKGPDDPKTKAILREVVDFLVKVEAKLEQHVAKNPADRPLMQKVRDLMGAESWYGILMVLTEKDVADYFDRARGKG